MRIITTIAFLALTCLSSLAFAKEKTPDSENPRKLAGKPLVVIDGEYCHVTGAYVAGSRPMKNKTIYLIGNKGEHHKVVTDTKGIYRISIPIGQSPSFSAVFTENDKEPIPGKRIRKSEGSYFPSFVCGTPKVSVGEVTQTT